MSEFREALRRTVNLPAVEANAKSRAGKHTNYVYIRSEPELWTVGFYSGDKWNPDSDHSTKGAAADRVHYLNGGSYSAERAAIAAQNRELVEALALAEALRPKILKGFGYVPEYVLDFCNNARAVLAKLRP